MLIAVIATKYLDSDMDLGTEHFGLYFTNCIILFFVRTSIPQFQCVGTKRNDKTWVFVGFTKFGHGVIIPLN